jgi:hypothetical protein
MHPRLLSVERTTALIGFQVLGTRTIVSGVRQGCYKFYDRLASVLVLHKTSGSGGRRVRRVGWVWPSPSGSWLQCAPSVPQDARAPLPGFRRAGLPHESSDFESLVRSNLCKSGRNHFGAPIAPAKAPFFREFHARLGRTLARALRRAEPAWSIVAATDKYC